MALDGTTAETQVDETTDEQASEPTPTPELNEEQALIEAVRAAQAEDGTTPEEAPEEKPKAKAKEEAPGAPETKQSKLAKILEEREQAKAGTAKLEAMQAQARADAAEVRNYYERLQQAEAKLQERERRIAENEAKVNRVMTDPWAAFKELGWKQEDVIDAATNPHIARQRQEREEVNRLLKERDQLWEARVAKLEALASTVEEQNETYAAEQSRKQFLASMPPESAARTIWEDAEILSRAYKIQEDCMAKGYNPSTKDLIEYVEAKAAEKLGRFRGTQSAAPKKNASKSSANGPRAITAKDASTRSGTRAKSPLHMTPSETEAYLLRVARGEDSEE